MAETPESILINSCFIMNIRVNVNAGFSSAAVSSG